MFGYVNISCNNISDVDKQAYNAYYCGLCKAIGRKSQLFRLGLNNDLTFLTVILSALYEEEPQITYKNKCVVHLLKKHSEVMYNPVTDYTADMNILLVYLKICDDVYDEKSFSKKLAEFVLRFKAKRVKKKYPHLSEQIILNLKKLSRLEKEKCKSIDETADCFAGILQMLFVPDIIKDDETRKIMSWIGYNLGRWIYILDAYNDLEKDIKSNNYNPFIYSVCDKAFVDETLTYSLTSIANAYELLDIKRHDSLIRNILYSGLAQKQTQIVIGTEEKDESI